MSNKSRNMEQIQRHDGCPDIVPEQSRFVHDDDLDNIINDLMNAHLPQKIMTVTETQMVVLSKPIFFKKFLMSKLPKFSSKAFLAPMAGVSDPA